MRCLRFRREIKKQDVISNFQNFQSFIIFIGFQQKIYITKCVPLKQAKYFVDFINLFIHFYGCRDDGTSSNNKPLL